MVFEGRRVKNRNLTTQQLKHWYSTQWFHIQQGHCPDIWDFSSMVFPFRQPFISAFQHQSIKIAPEIMNISYFDVQHPSIGLPTSMCVCVFVRKFNCHSNWFEATMKMRRSNKKNPTKHCEIVKHKRSIFGLGSLNSVCNYSSQFEYQWPWLIFNVFTVFACYE